ncbi:CRAL-TRIO domain-containing protein C3H8.02 like [Verticillium longisporum]|nr:CRAL-TRIO domain-containing protein C3H8.02 like [Verticillium longisporum]
MSINLTNLPKRLLARSQPRSLIPASPRPRLRSLSRPQNRAVRLTPGVACAPRVYRQFIHPEQLESRLDLLAFSATLLLICVGVSLGDYWVEQEPSQAPAQDVAVISEQDIMGQEAHPGRPGNLTADQEEKLRQLWGHVLKLCGVTDENVNAVTEAVAGGAADAASAGDTNSQTGSDLTLPSAGKAEKEKPKKKRISLFGKKHKAVENESPTQGQASPGSMTHIKEGDGEDKYGQTQQFFDALANQSPQSLHATIWSMVKHDHPDALLLRFLRARKWDVDKALVMMISTMNWRLTEVHVDDDIMKTGEAGAVADEQGADGDAKKLGADFMAQIRMGKSFLHGVDKSGRPICVVRVRLHKQGEQCEESLERYTVYLIETARMVLAPPVDTATIIFDMTGFSMANMDYTPVKFMIKCFEANYPESLGAVLVHKAPWVFQGIWRIIKGWLDPVVASKVHFTNNVKEMQEFIEPQRITRELDGQEDWEYKYTEPIPGENDRMKDTATRDKLLEGREHLIRDWEAATIRWIATSGSPEAAAVQVERENLAQKLRVDYWTLDPYLRARSYYDRIGVLQDGGKIDFYPTAAPASGRVAVETSANDLD